MTVGDLTVMQFIGLQALVLTLFYIAAGAVRVYDPDWPAWARLKFWLGMGALVGLPVYSGLRLIFPTLPTF